MISPSYSRDATPPHHLPYRKIMQHHNIQAGDLC
jgi:hypothetical protein